MNYWNSTSAKLLFNPLPNETVSECLVHRENIIFKASTNDYHLLQITDCEKFEDISYSACQSLRQKFIYLCKAYEIAIQQMNKTNWNECCILAIKELEDLGICFTKNNRTIHRCNIEFRKQGKFNVPYLRGSREPKVFSFFPESKEMLKNSVGNK